MLHPRESFKQTTSKVAKALVKHWPFLESLIVEKQRRRSSAMKSDQSSDEGGTHISSFQALSGLGHHHGGLTKKDRANSYQVAEPIEEVD